MKSLIGEITEVTEKGTDQSPNSLKELWVHSPVQSPGFVNTHKVHAGTQLLLLLYYYNNTKYQISQTISRSFESIKWANLLLGWFYCNLAFFANCVAFVKFNVGYKYKHCEQYWYECNTVKLFRNANMYAICETFPMNITHLQYSGHWGNIL